MNRYDRPSSSLVSRVLWRVETELHEGPTLEHLARAEGVSPFHLSRAFTLVTGQPLIAYVRARRLSVACQQLRNSDCAIVDVAFDAGYESHEGFARAFRRRFGISPSAARDLSVAISNMQEPFVMSTKTPKISARFEDWPGLRLVGMDRSYTMADRARIPAQWGEAATALAPEIFMGETFGVSHGFEGERFRYLVGYADDGRGETDGLDRMDLPAGRYAVFDHAGHISEIAATWGAIFSSWAPEAGVVLKDGPEIEVYETGFDPETPGGVSIWIPVEDG